MNPNMNFRTTEQKSTERDERRTKLNGKNRDRHTKEATTPTTT